jgi:hypothetical protein
MCEVASLYDRWVDETFDVKFQKGEEDAMSIKFIHGTNVVVD